MVDEESLPVGIWNIAFCTETMWHSYVHFIRNRKTYMFKGTKIDQKPFYTFQYDQASVRKCIKTQKKKMHIWIPHLWLAIMYTALVRQIRFLKCKFSDADKRLWRKWLLNKWIAIEFKVYIIHKDQISLKWKIPYHDFNERFDAIR